MPDYLKRRYDLGFPDSAFVDVALAYLEGAQAGGISRIPDFAYDYDPTREGELIFTNVLRGNTGVEINESRRRCEPMFGGRQTEWPVLTKTITWVSYFCEPSNG